MAIFPVMIHFSNGRSGVVLLLLVAGGVLEVADDGDVDDVCCCCVTSLASKDLSLPDSRDDGLMVVGGPAEEEKEVVRGR